MLLFDIDGVIRDVGASYRRAIVETVHHYSGRRPEPQAIDALKAEGRWNNDWEASMELLRRQGTAAGPTTSESTTSESTTSETTTSGPAVASLELPRFDELVAVFSGHYFGGDPDGDPALWRGFIGSEPLLVGADFFAALTRAGIAWGFVSGAEPPSARFVLERRLGLREPPLIAMGDAPDKPDPTGMLRLAAALAGQPLGAAAPPVAYLGDTVADVHTVLRARQTVPAQRWLSLAVAPPHLHEPERRQARQHYEQQLHQAGADRVIAATAAVLPALQSLLAESPAGPDPALSAPSPPGP